MAHPKRKISKTRRDKRRTHYKATTPQIGTDLVTAEQRLHFIEFVKNVEPTEESRQLKSKLQHNTISLANNK